MITQIIPSKKFTAIGVKMREKTIAKYRDSFSNQKDLNTWVSLCERAAKEELEKGYSWGSVVTIEFLGIWIMAVRENFNFRTVSVSK